MAHYDLAVAAKAFDKPSETFIRLHAQAIAPGRTVVLAADQEKPNDGFAEVPGLWGFRGAAKNRLHRLGLGSSHITEFLRETGVRAVLAEYGSVGRQMRPFAARAGVPLFVHFHGSDATSALRKRIHRWKHQPLFRDAAGVFAPSEFIKARLVLAGCPVEKISVTPCGVDPVRFTLSRRLPGRLLAVGRFVPKKAPLTLLKAFTLAAREDPRLRLDYVGDGELLSATKAQAQRDGVESRVTFHGAQSHQVVLELLGQAAIFVQHSVTAPDGDTEGLPVAILEAMAAGIPVVSTRHSGIPEAVAEGQTGYLVGEHDAQGMADAILQLSAAPEEDLAVISAAARQRLETQFSSERSLGLLRAGMGL